MITDRDIEKLKKVFMTIDDLKKELEPYATKEELNGTVNNAVDRLIEFITALHESTHDSMNRRFDKMEARFDDMDIRFDIFEKKYDNHEERILRIEKKLSN